MIVYHYSVEDFSEDDRELVGDYKKQYRIFEPFMMAMGLGEKYFAQMLYQSRYNQVCAEAKDSRAFSFWVKDATEGLFEFIRSSEFAEKSCSRITGIYYCLDKESSISCLKEDCIEAAGFKPEQVKLFQVELKDNNYYQYDQTFYNLACDAIEAYDVETAMLLARKYFAGDRSDDPVIEVISDSPNEILGQILWQ